MGHPIYNDTDVCQHCGDVVDPLARCGCTENLYSEITSLEEALDVVKEQDRLIGQLTREVTQLRERTSKRSAWLRNAKKEAGYPPEVSFDVVWEYVLQTYKHAKEG